MHNVLFFVEYIKRGGGAWALYRSIRTYTYIHIRTSGCVSRDNDVDARQRQ